MLAENELDNKLHSLRLLQSLLCEQPSLQIVHQIKELVSDITLSLSLSLSLWVYIYIYARMCDRARARACVSVGVWLDTHDNINNKVVLVKRFKNV